MNINSISSTYNSKIKKYINKLPRLEKIEKEYLLKMIFIDTLKEYSNDFMIQATCLEIYPEFNTKIIFEKSTGSDRILRNLEIRYKNKKVFYVNVYIDNFVFHNGEWQKDIDCLYDKLRQIDIYYKTEVNILTEQLNFYNDLFIKLFFSNSTKETEDKTQSQTPMEMAQKELIRDIGELNEQFIERVKNILKN